MQPQIEQQLQIFKYVNDSDVLKAHLDNGFQVDTKDETGFTLIHKACEYNNLQSLELLHQFDADINMHSSCGLTPLDVALKHGSDRCIGFLRAHNVIQNMPSTSEPITDVFDAIRLADVDYIKTLMKEGFDFSIQDAHGNMPIFLACQLGHDSILQELMCYDDKLVYHQLTNGNSLLHIAIECNRLQAIKKHIKYDGRSVS